MKVSLSPNDTVDTFVKKIIPFFYDQNFLTCEGEYITRILSAQRITTKESASKPLKGTPLWDSIRFAAEIEEYTSW